MDPSFPAALDFAATSTEKDYPLVHIWVRSE